jgi:hypothetical protein
VLVGDEVVIHGGAMTALGILPPVRARAHAVRERLGAG